MSAFTLQYVMVSPGQADGYADALLAILGQPWKVMPPLPRLWCPGCLGRIEDGEHREGCAWLTAARACGISD